MRLAAGILLICAAGAIGGCGSSEQDQIKAKVRQLTTAADAQDYAAICKDVLAPALVSRMTTSGVSCQYVMQLALASPQHRPFSIGKVTITGSIAQVITLNGAKGQQGSLSAVRLVKTSQGWRISSLNSPLPGQ
jgi:hypothetical protein